MEPGLASSPGGALSTRHRKLLSPEFRRLSPPIILIGMHRSGTSLVTGMLSLMGAYLGSEAPMRDSMPVGPPNQADRVNGCGECLRYRSLGDRYLEVEYEDIVRHPYSCAFHIAAFAGIAPGLIDIRRAAAFVARDCTPTAAGARPARQLRQDARTSLPNSSQAEPAFAPRRTCAG